ncbi:MAG: uncharacterized protein KVP18_000124 [Porospora cf. gigantea A]|uniref:uncharacterized protein n=2 Tax=Porospora cf. gigantea A TaxID=2853593 RepID=UPI00355ACA7D|nr:MAG: hypothetical protein KVP18_000124 [Porospora cf. gigantea A]
MSGWFLTCERNWVRCMKQPLSFYLLNAVIAAIFIAVDNGIYVVQKTWIIPHYPYPALGFLITQCFMVVAYWPLAYAGHIAVPLLKELFAFEFPDPRIALQIMPATITFVLFVIYAIYVLSRVGFAYIDPVKSLSMLFAALVNGGLQGQWPVPMSWAAITIVSTSFLTVSFVLPVATLAVGATSAFISASKTVILQKSLHVIGNDSARLMMYNTINTIPALLIIAPILDLWVFKQDHNPLDISWQVVMAYFGVGCLAFFANSMSFVLVKRISPVGYQLVGLTKATSTTIYGMSFYGELNYITGFCLLLNLVGSSVYIYAQYLIPPKEPERRPTLYTVGDPDIIDTRGAIESSSDKLTSGGDETVYV